MALCGEITGLFGVDMPNFDAKIDIRATTIGNSDVILFGNIALDTFDTILFSDFKTLVTAGFVAYTLPIATASTLGGIKVGTGLSIDAMGVLTAVGGNATTDASLLTSGILSDARLSANVPRLSNINTFVAGQVLSGSNTTNGLTIQGLSGAYPIVIKNAAVTTFSISFDGQVFAAGTYSSDSGFRATAFGAYVGVSFYCRFVFTSTGIDCYPGASSNNAIRINGESGQTGDLLQMRDSLGSVLSSWKANGAWQPASLADTSAANGTMYFSTTSGKMVYKDASGIVNPLY